MSVSSPPPPAPAAAAAEAPRLRKRRLPQIQELGLVVVVLLLGFVLWFASPAVAVKVHAGATIVNGVKTMQPAYTVSENGFLRVANLVPSVFTVMSWMAVMAIGQTIVIISGGIDISVGSIMGLSGFVTALVLQGSSTIDDSGNVLWHGYDWLNSTPLWMHGFLMAPVMQAVIGAGVACGVGLICGLINGGLVVGLRMHPFIVTLATLSIFRWGAEKIGFLLGNNMTLPWGDRSLAPGFTDHFIALEYHRMRFGGRATENLQFVPIVIMLVCLALGWIYLRYTVWGRETYALGGNEEAARYSGIRLAWVKMRVYALSGLSAGIAGMLSAGYYRSASADLGTGYELMVIAAAVVGGASLTGGRGTALGAFLGTLVLELVADGIAVLGKVNVGLFSFRVVTQDEQLILGLAILVAVAVDNLSMYISRRRSALSGAAAH
jgi:ribose/xylose/arabinose/galactoside ABC-type transport system permease subunit